jgi:hypothetical protein
MNPKKWGRHFWIMLIYIVNKYDNNNKKLILKLLKVIKYVLPCVKICRPHYKKHLKTFPDKKISTKNDYLQWLYNIRLASTKSKKHISFEEFLLFVPNNPKLIKKHIKKVINYVKIDAAINNSTSDNKIKKFEYLLKNLIN